MTKQCRDGHLMKQQSAVTHRLYTTLDVLCAVWKLLASSVRPGVWRVSSSSLPGTERQGPSHDMEAFDRHWRFDSDMQACRVDRACPPLHEGHDHEGRFTFARQSRPTGVTPGVQDGGRNHGTFTSSHVS